jgi:hypothetical protein
LADTPADTPADAPAVTLATAVKAGARDAGKAALDVAACTGHTRKFEAFARADDVESM